MFIFIQATLCCLFGVQAPPKSAEVLEHVAGNENISLFKCIGLLLFCNDDFKLTVY